jgi:hypothetical protein
VISFKNTLFLGNHNLKRTEEVLKQWWFGDRVEEYLGATQIPEFIRKMCCFMALGSLSSLGFSLENNHSSLSQEVE